LGWLIFGVILVDVAGDGNGHGRDLIVRGRTQLWTHVVIFPLQSMYQNDPQHLSGLVRRILYQFIGPT